MRHEVKLPLAAGACAAAALIVFAGLARPAPPSDFAWATSIQQQKAIAFAWATACEIPKPTKNHKGLKWVPAKKGQEGYGTTIYLVESGKCTDNGCTNEKVIGGWLAQDQIYRPWNGKSWGAESKPPIDPPVATVGEAAELITAALIGLVAEDDPFCPDGKCPVQPNAVQSATFSGGGTGVAVEGGGFTVYSVAEPRRGLFRRLLTAPFRAVRAIRANRVARVTYSTPVPVTTSYTTYQSVPVATYTLTPVTTQVPVTRYEWIRTPVEKTETKQPGQPG